MLINFSNIVAVGRVEEERRYSYLKTQEERDAYRDNIDILTEMLIEHPSLVSVVYAMNILDAMTFVYDNAYYYHDAVTLDHRISNPELFNTLPDTEANIRIIEDDSGEMSAMIVNCYNILYEWIRNHHPEYQFETIYDEDFTDFNNLLKERFKQ